MANTLRFKRGLASGIPTALAGEPLFTTDTFDLYIGNGTTNTRFQKYIASGTTSQLLRGDGSLLTMPIVLTSPANGQVLKFNGTNWVNDSDAGITGSGSAGQVAYFTGATTQGGSANLVWDNTNIRLGIGRTPTARRLELQVGNGSIASALSIFDGGGTLNSIIGIDTVTTSDLQIANVTGIRFYTGSTLGNIVTMPTNERMRLYSTGNLALGNPSTDNGLRFQVTGDGYFSGSVGIGGTPSYKLDIQSTTDASLLQLISSATANNTALRIGIDGNNAFINASGGSTGILQLRTYGTTRATLDVNGNLGLGVVPSAWTAGGNNIEVGSAGNIIQGQASQIAVIQNATFNLGWKYSANGFASFVLQTSGQHQWFTAPSGTAGNAITFTQAMTLDASGRLGIGIDVPIRTLHVNGGNGVRVAGYGLRNSVQSANSGFIQVGGSDNLYGLLDFNAYDSNTIFEVSNTNPNNNAELRLGGGFVTFRTGSTPTEAARIFSNGNFGINTGATDSGEKLQVNGTAKITGASTFARITTTTSGVTLDYNSGILYHAGGSGSYYQFISGADYYISNRTATGSLVLRTQDIDRLTLASTGAATFSSTAQAAGFITSGGAGYAVINSASNTVTALRPTGGGTSIMSTNSNGLHIAVGTEAAGDLILATNNTGRIRLSSDGYFSQGNGTNPIASITDSYIQYSADVVAGNAAPHFRTENGAIIKLYQETTAVGNSTISVGGGNAVLDDTEFGGYTLRQVVKALQNQGILA
jgi:hypothetical protein